MRKYHILCAPSLYSFADWTGWHVESANEGNPMTRTQVAARAAWLLIGISAISSAGFGQSPTAPAPAEEVQYLSLTPADFAEKAADLLNKDVEVAGDITLPRMMGPKSVGTMVDKASGKVLVQLV